MSFMAIAYRKRTRKELRRAVEWARQIMSLDSWCVGIDFDAGGKNKIDPNTCAVCARQSGSQAALIIIDLKRCEEDDSDPLHVVMHEMAHVGLFIEDVVDPDRIHTVLFEQAANRFGDVLYLLYVLASGDEVTGRDEIHLTPTAPEN